MGRSAWAGGLALAGWLAGAAAIAAWLAAGASGWRALVALAVLLAAGAWAGAAWWRQPAGVLSWDGSRWAFAGEGGSLRVALDLQHLLLVRWDGPGGAWFWLERRRLPARWNALRRAVYSPADRHALSGAEPPSVRP